MLPAKGTRWTVVAFLPLEAAVIPRSVSSALRRLGACLQPGRVPTPRLHAAKPGFLEIFAGVGVLSARAAAAGFEVHPPLDLLYGPQGDLLRPEVLEGVLRQIRSGKIRWVHLGTPCTTVCRFYLMFNQKCTRTSECPEGDGKNPREVEANRLFEITALIIRTCLENGVWWTLENPRWSLLWAIKCLQPWLRHGTTQHAFLVYCRFGSCFQKRTRLSGNLPGLQGLSCKCLGGHVHTRVEGRCWHQGRWMHVSQLAAAYPEKFCDALCCLGCAAFDHGR